jgi:hypothetical protein
MFILILAAGRSVWICRSPKLSLASIWPEEKNFS